MITIPYAKGSGTEPGGAANGTASTEEDAAVDIDAGAVHERCAIAREKCDQSRNFLCFAFTAKRSHAGDALPYLGFGEVVMKLRRDHSGAHCIHADAAGAELLRKTARHR